MVDRFRSGTAENDPDRTRPWTSEWYTPSDWEGRDGQSFYEYYVFSRLYGGDFQGLAEKLDYLKELGVTALYLNPVFQSPSHHKYNATNFVHIDEHYGVKGDYAKAEATEDLLDPSTWTWTPSDRIFLDFLKEAKARGMRVIVDGVFNHVGATHPAFLDVRRRGKDSPFADWFAVRSWDPFEYDGWAGFGELPVFAKSDDGLASDVGDAAHLRGHAALDGSRRRRRSLRRHRRLAARRAQRGAASLLGRVAKVREGDQSGRLHHRRDLEACGPVARRTQLRRGHELPFAEASIAWVGDRTNKIAPSELDRRLAELRLAYPAEATYCLMNLLDSHDTDRIASMLANPDREYDRGNREQDGAAYDAGKPAAEVYRQVRLLALLQMTYVGAPMIYYGDEVGMWGSDDPNNRKPMLWKDLEPYDGSGREPRHGGAARVLSPRDGASEPLRGAAARILPHAACRRRAGRLGVPARVREREGACRAQRFGPSGDGDGAGTRVDAGRLEPRLRPPSSARRAGSFSRTRDSAGLGSRVGHRSVSASAAPLGAFDGDSTR